jgi:hypothetical protein
MVDRRILEKESIELERAYCKRQKVAKRLTRTVQTALSHLYMFKGAP